MLTPGRVGAHGLQRNQQSLSWKSKIFWTTAFFFTLVATFLLVFFSAKEQGRLYSITADYPTKESYPDIIISNVNYLRASAVDATWLKTLNSKVAIQGPEEKIENTSKTKTPTFVFLALSVVAWAGREHLWVNTTVEIPDPRCNQGFFMASNATQRCIHIPPYPMSPFEAYAHCTRINAKMMEVDMDQAEIEYMQRYNLKRFRVALFYRVNGFRFVGNSLDVHTLDGQNVTDVTLRSALFRPDNEAHATCILLCPERPPELRHGDGGCFELLHTACYQKVACDEGRHGPSFGGYCYRPLQTMLSSDVAQESCGDGENLLRFRGNEELVYVTNYVRKMVLDDNLLYDYKIDATGQLTDSDGGVPNVTAWMKLNLTGFSSNKICLRTDFLLRTFAYSCEEKGVAVCMSEAKPRYEIHQNSFVRKSEALEDLILHTAGIDTELLSAAGHNLTKALLHCKDPNGLIIDCFRFFTKMEWYTGIGNTIKMRSSRLQEERLTGIHFGIRLEQDEYLSIQPTASLRMFVLAPDSYPLTRSGEHFLTPGYSNRIELHLESTNNIQKCERAEYMKTSFFPGRYSVEGCLRQTEVEEILSKCGCGHNVLNASGNGTCDIENEKCIRSALANITQDRFKDCLPPCHILDWQVLKTTTKLTGQSAKKDEVHVSLMFNAKKSLFFVEQRTLSAFINMGGLLGVQAGLSFISVVELSAMFCTLLVVGGKTMAAKMMNLLH